MKLYYFFSGKNIAIEFDYFKISFKNRTKEQYRKEALLYSLHKIVVLSLINFKIVQRKQ